MLTIEAVLDIVTDIDLVDYLIGVLLQGCCEDDNFIVSGHCLNELNTARSHEEEAIVLVLEHSQSVSNRSSEADFGIITYLDVVDQSLIQIEH